MQRIWQKKNSRSSGRIVSNTAAGAEVLLALHVERRGY